jgi:hypothetical protein
MARSRGLGDVYKRQILHGLSCTWKVKKNGLEDQLFGR